MVWERQKVEKFSVQYLCQCHKLVGYCEELSMIQEWRLLVHSHICITLCNCENWHYTTLTAYENKLEPKLSSVAIFFKLILQCESETSSKMSHLFSNTPGKMTKITLKESWWDHTDLHWVEQLSKWYIKSSNLNWISQIYLICARFMSVSEKCNNIIGIMSLLNKIQNFTWEVVNWH